MISASSSSGLSATTIWMVEQFGLAMTPECQREVLGIDLGDHERHVVVHAKRRGVVDHDAPGSVTASRNCLLTPAPAEKSAMSTPSKLAGVISSTTSSPPANATLLAGRARRRERDDPLGREAALLEHREHLAADGAGGTGDRDDRAGGHGLVPRHRRHLLLPGETSAVTSSLPSPKRRGAHGPRRHLVGRDDAGDANRRGRDHVDVHAGVGERRNILAATPGCVFMPAPTSETFADRLVDRALARAELVDDLVDRAPRAHEVVLGHGERDVGRARPRTRSG